MITEKQFLEAYTIVIQYQKQISTTLEELPTKTRDFKTLKVEDSIVFELKHAGCKYITIGKTYRVAKVCANFSDYTHRDYYSITNDNNKTMHIYFGGCYHARIVT